jgi:hypothetical protein
MQTHRLMPHVANHARTLTVKGSPRALQTDAAVRAARWILIPALAFGSLGAGLAESSGHLSTGRVSAHQTAGSIRRAAGANPMGPGYGIGNPWMY